MKRVAKQSRIHRHGGFTLIEIMIVIGIIALIAGIVTTNVIGSGDKAKFKLAQSQLNMVAGKIETYEIDNGQPPDRLEDLLAAPSGSTTWLGPYAKESELKDPWGTPLEYRRPGQNGKYDLISYGADGKPGGTEINSDLVQK